MRIVIAIALGVGLAACGASSASGGDGGSTGCRDERDCGGDTPYCEPSTGACVACRWSSHCTSTAPICEANTCRAAKSCAELVGELPGLPDGAYGVDLDGIAGGGEAQPMWCDMTTQGGGWTLVQRTVFSWAQSQALFTGFAAWNLDSVGMAAPGNAYRLAGERWPELDAHQEWLMVHRVRTQAGGACAPLFYTGTGTVVVDPQLMTATMADVTQTVSVFNDVSLSTTDSGPAKDTCVNAAQAVPWFYGGCCSTCATYKGGYWLDEPHPMQNYTQTTPDVYGRTETNVCGGQAVRTDDSTGSYRGDDAMELYLR